VKINFQLFIQLQSFLKIKGIVMISAAPPTAIRTAPAVTRESTTKLMNHLNRQTTQQKKKVFLWHQFNDFQLTTLKIKYERKSLK
jgi:hypothetical protein